MTKPKYLPGMTRYCKREGCGNEVTGVKKYCSRDCYPSEMGRQKNDVPGKLKICACPGREFFMDCSAGYQRIYAFKDVCCNRLKTYNEKHEGPWKTGVAKMKKSYDTDKQFRFTVCVGKGVDGKAITKGECDGISECSDSMCDGNDGRYEFEKNGNIDCYHRGKGRNMNTLGSSFAQCHQN